VSSASLSRVGPSRPNRSRLSRNTRRTPAACPCPSRPPPRELRGRTSLRWPRRPPRHSTRRTGGRRAGCPAATSPAPPRRVPLSPRVCGAPPAAPPPPAPPRTRPRGAAARPGRRPAPRPSASAAEEEWSCSVGATAGEVPPWWRLELGVCRRRMELSVIPTAGVVPPVVAPRAGGRMELLVRPTAGEVPPWWHLDLGEEWSCVSWRAGEVPP
jgi:hypothetical protein